MSPMHRGITVLFAAALAACQTSPTKLEAPAATPVSAATPAHNNLDAVLWMQSAVEYEAAVRGTYAAAAARLDGALADPSWDALPQGERSDGFETRSPAIIVDADETMIDNTPALARSVREGGPFAYERWLEWVQERRARAMPGAVEFAQQAAQRGVTIYFISNRETPNEAEATIANLRALGFPIADDGSNVLLRGDARGPGREKGARRRWVGAHHRVVLVLGDNLGDFLDGINSPIVARKALIAPYASWWGLRWFMQPNPSYGSWETAVMLGCGEAAKADPTACKRSALRFD